MASVISESSSSTTTTTTISSPVGLGTFQIRPTGSRIREASYILGEGPGQGQIRLNRLVTEALHGESSSELKNAELGRAATRALVGFGINQAREKRQRMASLRMGVDREEEELTTTDREGWESIQDYGNFLRETADTFRSDTFMPPLPAPRKPMPASRESGRMLDPKQISPIDRRSWRKFQFTAEFAPLAPVTARENRRQAQQSTRLIDWISDSKNDELFRGWGALDQAIDLPTLPEEVRRQHEQMEKEALEGILEAGDDQWADAKIQELGWEFAEAQGKFAKYLSQEAPQSSTPRLGARVTSVEPSRSNSMGGSDDDARSVVSQDNHWRRTIFG